MTEYKARACAKLNLYLDITGRRADGYHLLQTVMQSISLCDEVGVKVGDGSGISLSCSREDIPQDGRNTAYRAAEVFLKAAGRSAQVDISIKKNIPSGAGLAGGSADAAAVLSCLNRAFDLPLTERKLLECAAQVGADVPFCLVGGTKLCCGIGEEISPLAAEEEAGIYGRTFLVVKPQFGCPTGEAYRKYDEQPLPPHAGMERFRAALRSGGFAGGMYNVFRRLYSDGRIERLCGRLLELGAQGAELSGSGSSVFGVFDSRDMAENAARAFPECFTSVCTAERSGVFGDNE